MDDATWAPQSPDLSTYHSADPEPIHPQHQGYRGSISHVPPYSPPTSSPILQKQPSFMPPRVRKEVSMQDADSDYYPDVTTEKTRGKKPKDNNGTSGVEGSTVPPGTENINIKSHFPVARIKRIMQADDDVGKVAQVTPVVVSKALELFMISLVTKAASEAKARNSKRVGAVHLKQAVTKDEQFDFLSEIVSKVADAPAAAASKSDPDAMDVDGKKKKPRKGKRKDEDF
ncbi:histone-fold-containing protein [Lophiostoma macrostomum CBS 122681]|uniref:NCT transcriptional regulatory complex subunit A n=1 Tax=Lophiostoma macrostomum CBS 122681 TaxID=1314788 RepID=A0A6A6SY99_9PLEO|nr:histone-fold-containing protein [Lophiostoma macrostomum CBS 122681]